MTPRPLEMAGAWTHLREPRRPVQPSFVSSQGEQRQSSARSKPVTKPVTRSPRRTIRRPMLERSCAPAPRPACAPAASLFPPRQNRHLARRLVAGSHQTFSASSGSASTITRLDIEGPMRAAHLDRIHEAAITVRKYPTPRNSKPRTASHRHTIRIGMPAPPSAHQQRKFSLPAQSPLALPAHGGKGDAPSFRLGHAHPWRSQPLPHSNISAASPRATTTESPPQITDERTPPYKQKKKGFFGK